MPNYLARPAPGRCGTILLDPRARRPTIVETMAFTRSHQKITPALGSRMQEERGDAPLDVIVELTPDPVEPESVPELREAFEKAVEPVNSAIARCGGEVTDAAWLNRTVRAKLSAAGVHELTELHGVARVDVPHRIARD